MKPERTWQIVCPDGHVRHAPYHDEAEARGDAAVFTATGCRLFGSASSARDNLPPCGGGMHEVRRAVFDEPAGPQVAVWVARPNLVS